MIVKTITHEWTDDFLKRNAEKMDSISKRHFKQMRRYCINNRKSSVRRVRPYTIDGAKIFGVFIYLHGNQKILRSWFTLVDETREYYDLNRSINSVTMAYSIHFLRRYAERSLGNPDMELSEIIREYSFNERARVKVYNKGKEYVYASPHGIILGVYDFERNIMHAKTFVTKDMLKPTQRVAWEKVGNIACTISSAMKSGRKIEEVFLTIAEQNAKSKDAYELASDIYNEYFEDK